MSKTTPICLDADPSDESLMMRYTNGDSLAFEILFARYEPRVYAFFLRRTGSPDRAQDLYQELFLRVHRARDSYEQELAFRPWLFQIANHVLIDDLRRKHRTAEVQMEGTKWASAQRGIEAEIAERQQVAVLLAALSPDEEYALVAAKVEGVSYAELAARLGKSACAIRKMVSRSLLRLRSAMMEAAPARAQRPLVVPTSEQPAA